jgi:hypothetical protein
MKAKSKTRQGKPFSNLEMETQLDELRHVARIARDIANDLPPSCVLTKDLSDWVDRLSLMVSQTEERAEAAMAYFISPVRLDRKA